MGIDIYTHIMIHYKRRNVWNCQDKQILLDAFNLLIFIYVYKTHFLPHYNFVMSKGVAQHIFSQ